MFSSNASQVSNVANYIEDVFSTWLYTGNGSTQTITNGIDLAGKGGLVWIKDRTSANSNAVVDTIRGPNVRLVTNQAGLNVNCTGDFTAFNANGFSLGPPSQSYDFNNSGDNYASWTFRKQAKFFDIVTYTGTGSVQNIPHNLGSVPGCIIVKSTTATEWWAVQHQSLGATKSLYLNATNAAETSPTNWNNTSPTSTQFTVGTNTPTNLSGATYVAYLFAHDAGGFGLTGTDNVISCGSFTQSVGGFVDLGFEPQWVLTKRVSGVDDWRMFDNMRGMTMSDDSLLNPNLSAAENNSPGNDYLNPQPTGFTTIGFDSGTHIYIAIRRGPMKVPTDGTSVFDANLSIANGSPVTTGFPVDLQIQSARFGLSPNNAFVDRLRGVSTNATAIGTFLVSTSTAAEVNNTSTFKTTGFNNTGYIQDGYLSGGGSAVYWDFRRAPSVFDVVCYTGTSSARTVEHNLTVAPELIIVKSRSNASQWPVYSLPTGNNYALRLETTGAVSGPDSGDWNATTPTASVFSLGSNGRVNASGQTFVAYLFASCPGVSKVGSVTHVEPTTVVCGFIPRFILIKSTTATGTDDWFVFDSARGLVPGNDPYLRLNSTGAENTPFGAADFIDLTSDGFIMNGFSGGTYIFLAIA